MEMKFHKFVPFAQFKALEDGQGGFEGYASTFDNEDEGGDIVRKGAFSGTLDFFKTNGWIAVGHDWSGLPVGYVTDAFEDDKGLFIRTEYHSTPEAQAARSVATERLGAGKAVGLSIGYEILPGGWKPRDEDGFKRELLSLQVYEVSQVNAPMNVLAGLTGAKARYSEHGDLAEEALAALSAFVERSKSLAELRASEGRGLSESNRGRLEKMRTDMEELAASIGLVLSPPVEVVEEETVSSRDDLRKARVEFERLRFELTRIGV